MLVVVGGHSRNIGKTTAMEEILRGCPGPWWAFKVTQHGHGICATVGEDCTCADGLDHPFAIDEQQAADKTDSGRYLAAGAQRAFWVRTAVGELAYALPRLKELIAQAPNALVESNSILNFVVPDLYVSIADFRVQDLKQSARMFLSRADAIVVTGGSEPWPDVPGRWVEKPRLTMADLPAFVKSWCVLR
jgi:hypothetical protein